MSGSFQRSAFGGGTSRDATQVMFHSAEVQDEAASAVAGRPIFRTVERVQILIPGGFNQPVFNVTDEHRRQYPQAYEAFKKGHEMATEGTPIDQWAALTRAQVAELKALNIYSVEQCAALNDLVLQRIGMGGRQIKNAAIAYLDDAQAMALTTKLTRENDILTARILQLEQQVKEMGEAQERMFARQMAADHAQPATATHVPAQHDPVAIAQSHQTVPTSASSFDGFKAPAPRRRGRQPAHADADL